MMRKCFALVLIFLQVSGPAFASVLTVEEVSVIGAAADDYYTGSKTKLKVLDGNKVGRTLITSAQLSATNALSGLAAGAAGIAGIAYYERTGQDPVYAAANAVASAADALFVPGYQAFKANFVSPESYPASAAQYVGVEGSVGGTVGDILNLAKAHPETYPELNLCLASHVTSSPYFSSVITPIGSIVQTESGSLYNVLSLTSKVNLNYPRDTFDAYMLSLGALKVAGWSQTYIKVYSSSNQTLFTMSDVYCQTYAGKVYYYVWMYKVQSIASGTPLDVPEGDIIFPELKDDLSSPSIEQSEEIKEAVKELPAEQKITSPEPAPSTVPATSPSPLTNNQIQNFFAENTSNVYNEYLNTVNNGGDVNISQAAAELAKAQEEEAAKQTGETYSPISANPFGTAYNPGPYDIPTRFTTFLANVKTSGLFSFSSNFFNSLPGGGSPVYQIDGGSTFGTHTIDLSETMSGGLAVVKAVLLALFGFLSIRAIIMKR